MNVGTIVKTKPHTIYQYLVRGAVVEHPIEHQIPGGLIGVIASVEDGYHADDDINVLVPLTQYHIFHSGDEGDKPFFVWESEYGRYDDENLEEIHLTGYEHPTREFARNIILPGKFWAKLANQKPAKYKFLKFLNQEIVS